MDETDKQIEEKIQYLQNNISCLYKFINKLKEDPLKQDQLDKMKILQDVLTKFDKSIKLEKLIEYETILNNQEMDKISKESQDENLNFNKVSEHNIKNSSVNLNENSNEINTENEKDVPTKSENNNLISDTNIKMDSKISTELEKHENNDNTLIKENSKMSIKEMEIIDLSLDDDVETEGTAVSKVTQNNTKKNALPDNSKLPLIESESTNLQLPPVKSTDKPSHSEDNNKNDNDEDDVILVNDDESKPNSSKNSKNSILKNNKFNIQNIDQAQNSFHISLQPMFRISSVQSINVNKFSKLKRKSSTNPMKLNHVNKLKLKHRPTLDALDSHLKNNISKAHMQLSNINKNEPSTSVINKKVDTPEAVIAIEKFLKKLFSFNHSQLNICFDILQKVVEPIKYKKFKNAFDLYLLKSLTPIKNEGDETRTKKNFDFLYREIREMLMIDDFLTETGRRLWHMLKDDNPSKEFRCNSTKIKRTKIPNDNDSEYSPSGKISIPPISESVIERRKALQRESKQKCKEYLASQGDDDNFEIGLTKIINTNVKKTTKRTNSSDIITKTPILKKIINNESIIINIPCETDLLTPTWFEGHSPDNTTFSSNLDNDNEMNSSFEIAETNLEDMEIGTVDIFRNTNRAFHCRSKFIEACLLCQEKHNFVVSHYVNQHRDFEVLISRLPQRDVDYITQNMNFGYLLKSKSAAVNYYCAKCIFCKRDMSFGVRYWYEHYTMHTGEYTYQCSKCYLRRPRRQQIQRHVSECSLGEAEIITLHEFDKKTQQINAYICTICNYVQLHKINIINHLRSQHDLDIINGIHYHKVIFFRISQNNESDEKATEQYVNETRDSNSIDCTDISNYLMQSNNFTPNLIDEFVDDPSDDLSFTICGMLASNEPLPNNGIDFQENSLQNNTNKIENINRNSSTL